MAFILSASSKLNTVAKHSHSRVNVHKKCEMEFTFFFF